MKTIEKISTENRAELCEADRLFLPDDTLENILRRIGMPVLLYDEKGLRERAKSLSLIPQLHVREISVALSPFPEILRIAKEAGMNAVCRSPEELQIAVAAGFPGERICYAGLCTRPELAEILCELGATLLIGSPLMIPERIPDRVRLLCAVNGRSTFRLAASSNRPTAGLTAEEATVIVPMIKRRGVRDISLSVCPDKISTGIGALSQKADGLIRLSEQISMACSAEINGLHLGSGIGVGYNRFKPAPDLAAECEKLEQVLRTRATAYRIECDLTHSLVEPSAIFVASCLGVYEREKQTIQIDASFRQLAIPQFDRYRHISLLGKNGVRDRRVTDVIGTDLLAKDWFADSRLLPAAEAGDRLIVHDVGCCFGEALESFLVCTDGTIQRIIPGSDYFAESPDER